jgi:hypothetical protein
VIENKEIDPSQALSVIETEIDDVLQRVLLRSL